MLRPTIGSSSLPGQESSASGAGNIPLTQFPLQVSLLELHGVGSSANPTPSVSEPGLSFSGTLRFQFKHAPRGQQTARDKAQTLSVSCVAGFYTGLISSRSTPHHPVPLCLGEVRGPVSTRHPRCALSRRPEGGGCDGGLDVGSGSGRTCDSGGLQSEAGCPGPSPHHGCPHPPLLTRGRCCREGSRCLPAGSWCCNLGKEQHSLRTRADCLGGWGALLC